MGWNEGRDEIDLLQVKCLPDLFCTPEVTQMDRVEGTAKQPNPPPCRLSLNLSTLPDKKIRNKNVKL